MYNNSIVPELLPGGGGFSIYQYTLENLYTMHKYVRNWWTTSNDNLPLVRYLRCKFKLYQSEDVDYIFRYQNAFPMSANKLSYPTCQPSVLMMLNRTVIVPSKRTKRLRRGYKKIIIRPPSLLTNKWFFQANISQTPLLLTYCVAASLDHYYISTSSQSNNVTIHMLNTNLFQNREFGKNNAYNIRQDGTRQVWLWCSDEVHSETEQPSAKSVTLLADAKKFVPGESYETAKAKKHIQNWKEYRSNLIKYTGNPFYPDYLADNAHEHYTFYQSVGNYLDALPDENDTNIESTTNPSKTKNLVIIHNPLQYKCRYNPNNDDGSTNNTYLLKNYQHEHGWDPYSNTKLELSGFPLWINWWGFIDFQKQQHILTNIDTSTIFVTTSTRFSVDLPAYVPLCEDFILGNSPFEKGVNPADFNRWYPMVQYQEPAINLLLKTGPGTAKLEEKKTVEAKCGYTFYFKFGGNPAPMYNIKDPTDQPQFPIPNNISKTTSLQDPTTAPELFLYNFDQRRHLLTQKAAERISKDWKTKKIIFTDGTTTPTTPAVQESTPQTSEDEASTSEEEETLYQQLLKQRRKQQLLKHRINQLLSKLQTTQ